MAVIDNAVQALFKMAHKELLWENASPESEFQEQTLSVDTSGYDMIAVSFRGKASKVGNVGGGTAIVAVKEEGASVISENSGYIYNRSVYWESDANIKISNCRRVVTYGNASNRDEINYVTIPIAIYGIRGAS